MSVPPAEVAQLVEQWSEDQSLSTQTAGPNTGETPNESGAGGTAGPADPQRSVALSHEERLFVAIAKRGDRSIGQFIAEAVINACEDEDARLAGAEFWGESDEWLVRILEGHAETLSAERKE